MVRTLKILVLVIIFATGSLSPANAAVKAGASCKKVGQTAIQGKNSYKCVKSGKKLIWSIAKKTTTSPTQTPPPATPKSVPVALPTSPEIEKIEVLLKELMARTKPSKTKIELIIGPGEENQILAKIVQASVESSLQIAEALGFEFNRDFKVYVGDQQWLIPFMPEGTWCASQEGGVPAGSNAGFCGLDNGILFLNRTGFLQHYNGSRPIQRDFTKGEDRRLISLSFPHEIFHGMQAEVSRKYTGSRGFFNQFWLNEGGANVVNALALSAIEKISYREARTWVSTYRNCMERPEQFKVMDFNVNSGKEGTCGPYFAGFFWSEYLIAQSGELGALLNLAKTNRSAFDQLNYDPNNLKLFEADRLKVSLREVYKIDLDQFVPKADEYSLKSSNELKAWAIAAGVLYR
jgi:hypothetical protein